jgi:hypothetical protein
MNTKTITWLVLILASFINNPLKAQCADASNIYSFIYDGKSYEIVRENKTWLEAASCAAARGGYLVEINDEDENDVVFIKSKLGASINIANTTAFECGTCAFVWIGANDIAMEGIWIWDGNNDEIGVQFWMGDINGNPVGGLYSNWGNAPENFNDQDAAGLALNHWNIGDQGQWNDVSTTNMLYYVIEYDVILGTVDNDYENDVFIQPNPIQNEFSIINQNSNNINRITLFSLIGQQVKTIPVLNQTSLKNIDIDDLESGIYFLSMYYERGVVLTRKIVKQ